MAEPYIQAQTTVAGSSTGGAQANTVTIAGTAGKITYISGFEVTGAGATGASVITVTLAVGGVTHNFSVAIPAGAAVGVTPLIVEYSVPLPSTIGGNAVLTVPSFGAGNTNASANLHGYVSQI